MTRVRKVSIRNFRAIKSLAWLPSPGVNCLIGPGDSGKSTILDAIDLCLGARRNIQLSDADFFNLDEEKPIEIELTIGELDDYLKNLETHGDYLRGYNSADGSLEDEPERDLETVLTLKLLVNSDLDPHWSLVSDRAAAKGLEPRNLSWGNRLRLAPTRIGTHADYNLAWRRGSVLNQLAEDETPDASAALAKVAREARFAFGDEAEKQLVETLAAVTETAKELGIPVGDRVKALLDAHSVSFGGGTISLHDENGVPLRGLGLGSIRLLVAGLQRKAASHSSMILIDELEHGLEPHRIIGFLNSLGVKEVPPPLQVFATSHSPVALRELSGDQLFVVRSNNELHTVTSVGTADIEQGTIRSFPEAFLAKRVIICEGASEVGFIRGIDLYLCDSGKVSISAHGVSLVDVGGSNPDKFIERAEAFRMLDYRVSIFRDSDKKPTEGLEDLFQGAGGTVFHWDDGQTIEDAMFAGLPCEGVGGLLELAVTLHGDDLIDEHLKSASDNRISLEGVRVEIATGDISGETRIALGVAAKAKKNSWFKSVSAMEQVGHQIVGPTLKEAEPAFAQVVSSIFAWAEDA